MLLVWYSKGWEDYLQWQQEDKKVVRRINALIADALRHPTEGIGKPECLKHHNYLEPGAAESHKSTAWFIFLTKKN